MSKILEIENLTVSFEGFKALDDLNFSMESGELRTIIGPNGAGKTTFLDVITGKVPPTSGRVLFNGRDLRGLPEYKISQLGIGRKFQTPRVYLNLTVGENIDLVCNRRKSLWPTLFGRAAIAETCNATNILDTISLRSKANLKAAYLSHGEKQRLEIGMLVAQNPDLLLVDEPVAGLTDEETVAIADLLLDLAQGHSIIVIEHDMDFVRQIARNVTVLHQGSVLCEGSMSEVQADPRTIEVYLGQQPLLSLEQLDALGLLVEIAAVGLTTEAHKPLLVRMSRAFTDDPDRQEELQDGLQPYLKESPSEVTFDGDRETALKTAYTAISFANNAADLSAYQTFISCLGLSPEAIARLEAEVDAERS